jgi:hypothetical protein
MSGDERETDVGRALAQDAVRRVERIDVAEEFRVSPGRQILLPLIPAGIAVLIVLLVSPPGAVDPAAAGASQAINKQVRTTADTLRDKLIEKRKRAEAQGLTEAQRLFERLEQDTDRLAEFKQGDRTPALVKLNDLARQLEQRRDQLGGAENVRKQLDQLNNLGKGPADKMLEELARGNFDKALEQLKQLKEDLAGGKLSDQEREDLAAQLDQMQKKLQDLADAHQKAQEELEKRAEQARREGRDQEADDLQDQLNKLRQQAPQMDQLRDMADKLGQCSQCVRDGQLADAESAFNDLEAELNDLKNQLEELDMLGDAMDQLAQCRNQMNCPECGGQGCGACQGQGMGLGKGQGAGPRPEAETPVNFRDTRTAQKIGPGGASVVGEVEGPNIKGDVRQEVQEQYQSARSEEADPLTEQRMPRKLRQHAQEYFNRFREGE